MAIIPSAEKTVIEVLLKFVFRHAPIVCTHMLSPYTNLAIYTVINLLAVVIKDFYVSIGRRSADGIKMTGVVMKGEKAGARSLSQPIMHADAGRRKHVC